MRVRSKLTNPANIQAQNKGCKQISCLANHFTNKRHRDLLKLLNLGFIKTQLMPNGLVVKEFVVYIGSFPITVIEKQGNIDFIEFLLANVIRCGIHDCMVWCQEQEYETHFYLHTGFREIVDSRPWLQTLHTTETHVRS